MMKLTNIKQVEDFISAVNRAHSNVWLVSPQGDRYNMKSALSQYIALGATCMTVLGFVINLATQSRWSMTMCGYGVMIGLISYFFGGIKTAVKMAGKIAKWGWIILPFPYDIVTGLVAFFISIFVFMALPIIPIRKAYKEQSME